MKKILLILFVLFLSCGTGGSSDDDDGITVCGTYNGHTLYKGPKGGCYYINSNKNKTYVDRSYCNCF